MELGLDFDDADFECGSSTADIPALKSYNAKFLSPLWFKDLDSNETEKEQCCKFMGDHYYHEKKYDKAIECYTKAFDLLPINNKIMRREIQESLARSYTNAGRHTEGLELGKTLLDTAATPELKLQSLVLISSLQESVGDWKGLEGSLKQMLDMHPYSGRLWLSLGRCIQHGQMSGTDLRVLSCLIRARLLFKSTQKSVASFIKDRHQQLIQQIDGEILQMNLDTHILEKVNKAMSEDFYNFDQQDDKEQKEHKQAADDFEKKWFSWTKDVTDVKMTT